MRYWHKERRPEKTGKMPGPYVVAMTLVGLSLKCGSRVTTRAIELRLSPAEFRDIFAKMAAKSIRLYPG